MRLLYTLPDYWPYVRRGSERIVHELAEDMTARGNSVAVVTRSPAGPPRTVDDGGVSVTYRAPHPRLAKALRWEELETFAFTAAGAMTARGADLYHAFYITDAYGMAIASRWRRRPFVLSLHGPPHRGWWESAHPRTHSWLLRVMERAARVTVMSERWAVRMRDMYGYEPFVVSPGIHVADYAGPRAAGEVRTVVCAAAVDDGRKRLDVLIAAFALVARDQPDLRLLLVGPGDPAPARALAAAQGDWLAPRVEVRPATDDLAPVYAACTVGALTSQDEAFGLATVEYLASGMPAVVSDDGGSADIVSEGTGIAFAVGDIEACAAALQGALDLAAQPGTVERCRARAQEYDWSRRGADYLRLYAECG